MKKNKKNGHKPHNPLGTHDFLCSGESKHQSIKASEHQGTNDTDYVRTTLKITKEHNKKLKQSALDENRHVYEILKDALTRYFKE